MSRILVVDDDDQIREMLRQMLEKEGFEVSLAPNGKVAEKLHRKEPANLMITDIIMPDQEGLETIQNFGKKFPDVKIIAMSGGGLVGPNSYLNLAKKFGAVHTFTKPIDMDELLGIIQKVMQLED